MTKKIREAGKNVVEKSEREEKVWKFFTFGRGLKKKRKWKVQTTTSPFIFVCRAGV